MTKFGELLLSSMAQLLRRRGCDVVRVTSYREVERSDGYCETCYFDWTEVEIYYLDRNGETLTYNYGGNFADLIKELTDD